MEINVAVLQERIKVVERENSSLKKDVRQLEQEIDSLYLTKETMLYKLNSIEKTLEGVSIAINRDSGWRGFMIDVVKAAAQIAALVGIGKMIL